MNFTLVGMGSQYVKAVTRTLKVAHLLTFLGAGVGYIKEIIKIKKMICCDSILNIHQIVEKWRFTT